MEYITEAALTSPHLSFCAMLRVFCLTCAVKLKAGHVALDCWVDKGGTDLDSLSRSCKD